MEPFRVLTSHAVVLPRADINTDDIIPAQYLKVTEKAGLARGLFARWRYRPDGTPDPAFPLNRPEAQGARILVTGPNFGSGSSREHAVWALWQWGFRAVLAPSFADIFYHNAIKNGLLPARLSPEDHQALLDWLEKHPQAPLTVNLETTSVVLEDGQRFTFAIDAFARRLLLQGLDELDVLLQHQAAIEAYERAREGTSPSDHRPYPPASDVPR